MSISKNVSLPALADGINSIIRANPGQPRGVIEDYLEAEMKNIPLSERLDLLENLILLFPPEDSEQQTPGNKPFDVEQAAPTAEIASHLCSTPPGQKDGPQQQSGETLHDPGFGQLVSLVLGKKVSVADLSPAELSEKLALAMNTVFDTLNQIVEMIQVNLLGRKTEQETIRQIIGSQIGSSAVDNSLQNYLDQIREAFLVAHKAFRIAAVAVAQDLLAELDPEKIASASEGKLKFGPLRKAELFEVYKEKFGICKGWFESGRVLEGFLREFEKACQKVYKK